MRAFLVIGILAAVPAVVDAAHNVTVYSNATEVA